MEFKKLNGADSSGFREAWDIYESSFPPDERRSLSRQIGIFGNPRYRFFEVYDKGQLAGILTTWKLEKSTFIEHFAVSENLRGHGTGTRLMTEYMSSNSGRIVLEAERLNTRTAERRIEFYERLGFRLNGYDYVQPPYGKGKKPVPCFLMSYPEPIASSEFPKVKEEIYSTVYGIESPALIKSQK